MDVSELVAVVADVGGGGVLVIDTAIGVSILAVYFAAVLGWFVCQR